MLPHISEFVMSVHNLYRQSLLDILALSLKELDPRRQENLAAFEAFSVGSFFHAHENPADLSQKYGTPILSDLLTASVEKSQPVGEKEKKLDSAAELSREQENEVVTCDIFKTSYRTGVSPLSDEEIFNLVKILERNQFLGGGINNNVSLGKIDQDQIESYEVHRNKFYIDVRIFMIGDIDALIFRQSTNYSNQLNFSHDKTILEPATHILKKDYGYDLPTLPSSSNFPLDSAFEQAAEACRAALDQGERHLMNNWLKTAIRLSDRKCDSQSPSIAERYKAGYDTALVKLSNVLSPLLGNLGYHIKMAVNPDIISGKILPKLSEEASSSSPVRQQVTIISSYSNN